MTKICIKCEKNKFTGDYYRSKVTTDGFEGQCKKCKKGARKPYNKEAWTEFYRTIGQTEEYKEKKRRLMRRKLKIPQNHISHRMSNQIYKVIGQKKRNIHWGELVGYTATQLKQHLESQFTEGMCWDNYGKWHIDHKIPQAFFKFSSTDDVEFRMCWRLENLQPLWAKDNIKKSNKLSLCG